MNFLDEYLQVIHEKKDKTWISKAISKPGALHKALDVPKMVKRKNLAKTLKKMHHEGEAITSKNVSQKVITETYLKILDSKD